MLKFRTIICAALILGAGLGASIAKDKTPAKELFGAVKLPALTEPASAGFYSKGCLSGGVAIPVDGPAWQVMRLSRNRNWGHPDLIKVLERLAVDGQKVGWNGLLVGDISQPRGGPMLTGHASHQIGLDADVWLQRAVSSWSLLFAARLAAVRQKIHLAPCPDSPSQLCGDGQSALAVRNCWIMCRPEPATCRLMTISAPAAS